MSLFLNFSILTRNRNYALLFAGQFISFAGTMITSVALPYQIYHETRSTLLVGLLSFFQLAPLLFTALLGGALADRYPRRRLLIIAELLLAIACLLLMFNALTAKPNVIAIFVVATLAAGITGLHRPALESLTQQMVNPGDFGAASSLSMFQYSVCAIGGPALGGLLIAHFGVALTYFIDFCTFAASLGALSFITNMPKPAASETDHSTWQALKSGFRYALSRQDLMGTYVVDFVAMIFGMPNALFPAIAHSYGGAKTLGLLYSAPAVGALLISFTTGWVGKVKRHGAAIAIAAVLWGIAIIFFGLAHNLWLALFFLALAGAFDAISGIFRQILWNETIPAEFRGRLSGIAMISYLSGPRLGDAESGLVAAAFGVTFSIISGGILCVIGVALCCYWLPKFWRYEAKQQV